MRISSHTLTLSVSAKRLITERAVWTAILILIAAPSLIAAQKGPNFSGRWELDAAQSRLRPMTKWNHMMIVIVHQEPELIITTTLKYADGSDSTSRLPLTTDGREVLMDGKDKRARAYRARRVGAKIVIKWNQGGERSEIWTLSPDGRTLTIDCNSKPVNGPADTWKYVLIKK